MIARIDAVRGIDAGRRIDKRIDTRIDTRIDMCFDTRHACHEAAR